MKISGEFESCGSIPEYIEIEFNNKANALIKLEDVTINENNFFDNDAYFLGDINIPETKYLFDDFDKIVDDFENDVFFKSLIAEDDTGKVTITTEESPEGKVFIIKAEWYNVRENTHEDNTLLIRPDLTNAEFFKFKELDVFSKSLNVENYLNVYQTKVREEETRDK